MSPKGHSPGIAISDLQEALQLLPVRKAAGAVDARSLSKSRRIITELEKQGKPSEIAELLGVRTQKYVWMRKYIREGKVSSPVLNDLLEGTLQQSESLSYGDKEATFISEAPDKKGRRREKISYVGVPIQFLNDHVPWSHRIGNVGGYASLQSCLNWYGNIGGTGYFWIAFKRTKGTGKIRYFIYDVRTPSELALHRKGKTLKKELRANKVLREHGHKYGIRSTGA